MSRLTSADFIEAQRHNPRAKARRLRVVEFARMSAHVDLTAMARRGYEEHAECLALLDLLYQTYLEAPEMPIDEICRWSLVAMRTKPKFAVSSHAAQETSTRQFVRSIELAYKNLPTTARHQRRR